MAWQAKLWDLRHVDPKECLAVLAHGGVVNSAYFSPVNKHVSFTTPFSKKKKKLRFVFFFFFFFSVFYFFPCLAESFFLSLHGQVTGCGWSQETGGKILTTCQDNKIRVWDYLHADLAEPRRAIVHSHDFNRYLTAFRAEWDPKVRYCLQVATKGDGKGEGRNTCVYLMFFLRTVSVAS